MGILPPRPLKLADKVVSARRRKALLLSAMFVAFGCAWGAGGALLGRPAWRERTVWERGTEGRLLGVGGKVEATTKFGATLIYDYHLDVVYADASGAQRPAKVKFDTVWKPVDTAAPASIRYLADDPEHPVLSWAIDAGGWRWGMPILMGAFALMSAFAAIHIPLVQSRAGARLRVAAEDGEEVLFPLLSVTSFQGHWTVRYETSPGVKAAASAQDAPLVVVRDGRQHVVALRSPRTAASVLVPGDLSLFDFDPATRADIARRAGG